MRRQRFSSISWSAGICVIGLLFVMATAWAVPAELEQSYAASESRLTERYGIDRDQFTSLLATAKELQTTDGRGYVIMRSTVDFDLIQVCLWFSSAQDDRRLGTTLTQLHFQSLALKTVRVMMKSSGEDVSMAAASLHRLGINYGELFRELCGADGGFALLDAGLRVKVSREKNDSGCFYISQLGREEVCHRLEEAGERLKLKYDVPFLRQASRLYLKKFLTYELSGHRLSRSHLRQTFTDLYGLEHNRGILRRIYPGRLAELEALRLLAYGTWLQRQGDLALTEDQREELTRQLPQARKTLAQVWSGIPMWWRIFLERALGRVGERNFVSKMSTNVKSGAGK